ncbi:hypothetical protein H5410_061142 [Solanum commersonii]|uniref:Uncharacterized protein n=1 Tax=Solanum commersonii TaxID=4109 RepID=A0A9J5W894_SOLCO|nr:hypothetical protein H5410_061142 [Solanum commersonii]
MNLMSTHSLGHQSIGLGFAISLSGKPKIHGWFYEWRILTSNLGKMKSFSLQVSHKTLFKLERKYLKKISAGNSSTSTDFSFHHRFDPLPSGLCILEQRAEFVLSANRQRCLAMLRLQLLHSFQPFYSFLRISSFNKGVSNNATQDLIMSAHNKTQFTYARINYVLKDSSCDTPLPKILMLTNLATCASSTQPKSI